MTQAPAAADGEVSERKAGPLWRAWWWLWFREVDARPLAAIRVCAGIIAAWSVSVRFVVAESAYSDAGWMSEAIARQFLDPRWSFFYVFRSPVGVTVLMAITLVVAVRLTIGLWTRVSSVLCFVLITSMQVRNPVLAFGGDAALRMLLFYVALGPAGEVWSIDAVVRARRDYEQRLLRGQRLRRPVSERRPIPVWPLRLMQFQLGLIYFATGMAKVFGITWAQGSTLWYALLSPAHSRFNPDGQPLPAWLGGLTRIGTWVTLAWEFAFVPMVIVHRYARWIALGLGILFHVGIFAVLEVQWFSAAMLTYYLAFAGGPQMRGLELRLVRRLRGRLLGEAPRIVFDEDELSRYRCSWLLAADHFRVLELTPLQDRARWSGHTKEALGPGFHVVDRKGRRLRGIRAYWAVAAVCPALAVALPLVLVPGLGHALVAIYRRIEPGLARRGATIEA